MNVCGDNERGGLSVCLNSWTGMFWNSYIVLHYFRTCIFYLLAPRGQPSNSVVFCAMTLKNSILFYSILISSAGDVVGLLSDPPITWSLDSVLLGTPKHSRTNMIRCYNYNYGWDYYNQEVTGKIKLLLYA